MHIKYFFLCVFGYFYLECADQGQLLCRMKILHKNNSLNHKVPVCLFQQKLFFRIFLCNGTILGVGCNIFGSNVNLLNAFFNFNQSELQRKLISVEEVCSVEAFQGFASLKDYF